jgi:hypothetical protein
MTRKTPRKTPRSRRQDHRIIDLDKPFSELVLPLFLQSPGLSPINMTLCAGDGFQKEMTDIEWFTTRREGHGRETKKTTIFMVAKNYSPRTLQENIKYLKRHPELKVVLLVFDDNTLKYKDNLVKLFPQMISNIYEDFACYGDKLDLKTLYEILKDKGTYTFNYPPKLTKWINHLYLYDEYLPYFTINLDTHPCTIIKDDGNRLTVSEKSTDFVAHWRRPDYSSVFSRVLDHNDAVANYKRRKLLDEEHKIRKTRRRSPV